MHNSFFFCQQLTRAPSEKAAELCCELCIQQQHKGTTTRLIKPLWNVSHLFPSHAHSTSPKIFQNRPIVPSLYPQNITPGDYTNYLLSQESHGSRGNNKCVIHSAATSLFLQTAFKLPFINHCLWRVCDQNSCSPFSSWGGEKGGLWFSIKFLFCSSDCL